MDDKTLMRLSLVCSLAGLAAVYAAALSMRPRVTPIAAIDNSFVGTEVVISGEVVDTREHQDGHIFLKLSDQSGGTVSVPIFSRLRAEIGESVEILDIVEARGEVVVYRGELEVVPEDSNDLKVIHTAPASVSSIGEENVGQQVKVQGSVAERRIVGNGNIVFSLREGETKLEVFVPKWIVEEGLPEVHVGDLARFDGWLQLYDNELELKITSASNIHLIEAA